MKRVLIAGRVRRVSTEGFMGHPHMVRHEAQALIEYMDDVQLLAASRVYSWSSQTAPPVESWVVSANRTNALDAVFEEASRYLEPHSGRAW